jgi:hypothetical protein
MGLFRKATFVATGGLSGAAGVRANSKKDRTAKALEEQNRLIKQQLRATAAAGTSKPRTLPEKRAAKHAAQVAKRARRG